MSKLQIFATCVGLAISICLAPDVMAASHSHSSAYKKVEQLIQVIDKNGQVSETEFLQFMGGVGPDRLGQEQFFDQGGIVAVDHRRVWS